MGITTTTILSDDDRKGKQIAIDCGPDPLSFHTQEHGKENAQVQDFVDIVSVPVEGPASHGKCAQAADDKLEKVQNSGIHQANSSNESDVEKDPYAGFLVMDVH